MRSIKNKCKIGIIFVIGMLFVSSALVDAVPMNVKNKNTYVSNQNIQSISPKLKKPDYKTCMYLSNNDYEMHPLNEGSTLDQYQTYGDCWLGTTYYVLKIAQRFKPTLEYLDFVKLKIWINFNSPAIDIKFYIYNNNENTPGLPIEDGASNMYSSDDFTYSLSIPDPNNDNQCPWYTIEFPDDPKLTIEEYYWIVMEIGVHLSDDKHVCLAGYDGDLYSDGYLAWYSNENGWDYDLDEWDIDLMFKTYGYNDQSHTPRADADGPYYGFINGGETIIFDGTGSYDNDEGGETIERYDWKFYEDDSWNNDIGPQPSYTYKNDGTYSILLRVHDNEGDTAVDATTVTIHPPGVPHVNYVDSYYADGSRASNGKGLFLQGMNLSNTYTASVSGLGVNKVEFTFGFETYIDNNVNDGWNAIFNTEDIINPYAKLAVKAHNQQGWGPEKTYSPRIIPMAGWLVEFIEYVCQYNDTDYVSFYTGVKDNPPKPKDNYWTLNAAFDFSFGSPLSQSNSPVEAGTDVPVEDIGGTYSYSGGIGSSVTVCSDGTIDVYGGFEASVTVKNVNGSVGASVHGSLTIGDGIIWQYMYIIINGEVTIPVFYIPFEVFGIGVEAGIDIMPHVEVTFHLEPTSNPNEGIVPGLGIKIKDESGIEGNVGATITAYAEAGFAIGEFYTEAGGDATLYFQTPSPPGYFKDLVLSCWIGGKLRLLGWTAEAWWTYDWKYSEQRFSRREYTEIDWAPLNRDYINPDNGDYNEFVYNDTNGPFIVNSFPFANPYIAYFPGTAGNKVMIAWSHDNEEKPRVKGMEIQYTIWDKDGGMDTPQSIAITADNKLQMDPQLVFNENGDAICVFVQTDSSISENSDFDDVCNSTEIAYVVWDHNTETWSSINLITNNNKMDVSPLLTSNSNGDIALIWTSDNDNDQTTISDRSIFASFWNNNSWSIPQILVQNKSLVSTPQTAIDEYGSLTTCVFALDEDNDSTTANDQNIYYTTFTPERNNINIVQFTNDSQFQDTFPSVIYGQDGQPYIVWLKNKHDEYESEELFSGTLYYKQVGSNRVNKYEITNGSISGPITIRSQGSFNRDNFNFAVGWGGGKNSHTLNCAKIYTNHEIERGVIYGSQEKISEISWCIAPGTTTTAAIERPILKNHSKNCKLSFIYAHGFDNSAPVTTCNINGDNIGYGSYGPVYNSDVIINLNATDDGGSKLQHTHYCLDSGSWQIYEESITVSTKKPHVLRYYSQDKAENTEEIHICQFQIVDTLQPEKPLQAAGPTSGTVGKEYIYSTTTIDPDGDQVYYKWNWGNEVDNWIGPYMSGETCYATHTWDKKGNYEVKVMAKDYPYGRESNWSDPLPVTMPITYLHSQSKQKFKILLLNFIFAKSGPRRSYIVF